MSVEFRTSGFGDLAIKLERASRDLDRTIRDAVGAELDRVPAAVRKSAREMLPRRGGFNDRLAHDIDIRVVRRAGSASVYTLGTARNRRDRSLRELDRGVLRHPVFGHRVWVAQVVTPYFWSTPVKEHAALVERAVREALDKLGKSI